MKLILLLLLPVICRAKNSSVSTECSNLLIGQYRCSDPVIDSATQEAANCTPSGFSKVACYPVKGIYCNDRDYNGKEVGLPI